MKVIIIKEKPNIHLSRFIKEVNKQYEGKVTIINYLSNTKQLLSEEFQEEFEEQLFIGIQKRINASISKELIFIYMNNDDKINILQDKYKTITVDEDFIFDILEYKDDKIKLQNLINKLI